MTWFQAADTALFRFFNQTLTHPVLDWLMPQLSSNALFVPAVFLLGLGLIGRGGAHGRIFVLSAVLILALGDAFVINLIKHALARSRPFMELADARVLVGKGGSGGMPSSHTSTWFAATFLAHVFYRRSWRFLLPLAAMMAWSRVYVGVHYPGDVLAGAALGAGYAAAGLWTLEWLWQSAGRRWFPVWWRGYPSLFSRGAAEGMPVSATASGLAPESHYLRLGYGIIGVIFVMRLVYIASGSIEASKDEAYQWIWSKHLALSYYSKPPMIAYLQYLGTHLWGDNAFGIRFCSPVIGAILGWIILRFMAREVNARAGLWLILVINGTPLMAVGTVLMTIDPPLVLFWTLAMVAGWRAIRPEATVRDWLAVGLAMGLGFLSKYTAAFQIVCWAILFALYPPARPHLRRPGPYLALGIFLLCTIPVAVWNAQHGWITVEHVAGNAGLGSAWKPTLRFFGDFAGVEAALLNPVFFVGALWAMGAFWRRRREHPLLLYFFCMGAPVFLGYWAWSLHSRILPNWIAVAILPMFCQMVVWWQMQWQQGARWVKPWLIAGLSFGFVAVAVMHETRLVGRVVGQDLPPEMDPLRRVRGWKETAQVVGQARAELAAATGKPAFIIADHYGMTGLITLYLPEATAALRAEPLVYARSSPHPENQFYFWPGYRDRRPGQDAIYVAEVDRYDLEPGWVGKWLRRVPVAYAARQDPLPVITAEVAAEFASVKDLGVREITWRGKILRRIRLYECRNLLGSGDRL